MATKEELFISFRPKAYRAGKSSALMSQANLLANLKRLYNLRVLARQKNDLKKRLHKLFTSIENDIESIQDKMPTPQVPKSIISKQPEEENLQEIKEKKSIQNALDDELKLIQEKLQELND